MNIVVFNGSPRETGNTAKMTEAFAKEAMRNGHCVDLFYLAQMNIGGCRACEYCKGGGRGNCIQKDDFEVIASALKKAECLVIGTPMYFFGMSSYTESALQRIHAFGMPERIKKSVLLIASGAPQGYDGVIAQYKAICNHFGIRDLGIITCAADEDKRAEVVAIANRM